MATMTDLDDVLGAAVTEVTRQETRVDVKAGQLTTLAGILATVAVAAVTGIGAVTRDASGWLALMLGALMVAASLWAGAVGVLLHRIIRPQLTSRGRGSFVNNDHVGELRNMSLVEYRESLVDRLTGLVLARYRAVRLASDLLVAGFVSLIVAGLIGGMLGLL